MFTSAAQPSQIEKAGHPLIQCSARINVTARRPSFSRRYRDPRIGMNYRFAHRL